MLGCRALLQAHSRQFFRLNGSREQMTIGKGTAATQPGIKGQLLLPCRLNLQEAERAVALVALVFD